MSISSICVVGPGAIGGMMAVKLCEAGFLVSTLVRSHRIENIIKNGITLLQGGETFHAAPKAADTAYDLGPQDLVVLTVKEFALKNVAPLLYPLFKDETQVVQVTNGIPWWFFTEFGDGYNGVRLESLDPGGSVSKYFDLNRHIGGVINCGASVMADGVIRHEHSNQLFLGRPNNKANGLKEIAEVFSKSGYETLVALNIHQKVMDKLVANLSFNPVSALAMGTNDMLLDDPYVKEVLLGLMNEGRAIIKALGLDPGPDPAEKFEGRQKVASSRTSMLQDVEQRKQLELSGILASTIEVAELVNVAVPLTKIMYGLLRVKESVTMRQFTP